jgi:membrane-associated protease RseP (regulator of RpoE activity)
MIPLVGLRNRLRMERWRGLVGAALAAAACASPADAQVTQSPASAWVGVGLEDVCERTPDGASWSCSRAPEVQSVVLDSPADRAGLMPGDRLISIDGLDIATEAGDQALSDLQVGRPVSVVVARGDSEFLLTVEPAPRPANRGAVMARTLAPSRAAGPRIVTLPGTAILADSIGGDVEVVVDSAGVRGYSYRFRLPDGSVQEFSAPRIDVPLRLRMTRPGTADDVIWKSYLVAELLRMSRGVPDSAAAAQYYDAARRLRATYEDEVAPRLRATYDSALATARAQLDSLLVTVERPAPGRGRDARQGVRVYVETPQLTGGRVAGAEFEELNSGLADAIGATELGIGDGLFVVRVLEGTPAALSGLRPGDLVIEASEQPVASVAGLRRALLEDEAAEITWVRKGQRMSGRFGGE